MKAEVLDRDEILQRNRAAWNLQVERGNRWTVPVDESAIAEARGCVPRIVLTPQKRVPESWFPKLHGCKVLMLASGGGQQVPILAAAGAEVTSFDLSDGQLQQDRLVAEREGLHVETHQGSMDDLSVFSDGTFDLVIQPCSNSFAPDLEPVWREAFRVLKPGGTMMCGFCNPLIFLFDYNALMDGKLEVVHALPYSDSKSLSKEELQKLIDDDEPLMFGHTLTAQLGKQLEAGFRIKAIYEDKWGTDDSNEGYALLDAYTSSFVATLAEKSVA